MKQIMLDNYDIDGNLINVITCATCGNQIKREWNSLMGKNDLTWYSKNMNCCEKPDYWNGIYIPE